MNLPPCGFFKTTIPIGAIEADRLVYFHNHGDPGPGIYPPHAWKNNRARFSEQGSPLEDLELVDTLEPLAPEGLYRIKEDITCCEKNCTTYSKGLLVQLGYNGKAQPILFVPQWKNGDLTFPERGNALDEDRIAKLERLDVADASPQEPVKKSGQQNVNLLQ
ncbi:hypothetical protein KAI87_04605 [Myxococcota bacterium]|nr:hypothetical protein [Myxococcota bacterium]